MLFAFAHIAFIGAGYLALRVTRQTILERKLDMIRAFRGSKQ